jgi:hypothetical protein
MVILTASVGQKCAVLLPNNFFNLQATPSTGIIIKRTLDRGAVVLIEEVWQFFGLETESIEEKISVYGSLRQERWGWVEIPRITDKVMVINVKPELVKEVKPHILEGMIHTSVSEFKRINRI